MAQCPSCRQYQKASPGLSCEKCSYVYSLDETVKPYLSDKDVAISIQILSGQGKLYFTKRHFYSRLYDRAKYNLKVQIDSSFNWLYFGTFILAILGWILANFWTGLAIAAVLTLITYLCQKRKMRGQNIIEHGWISKAMADYTDKHEIDFLVTGDYFVRNPPNGNVEELAGHAPERILIVEHDTWVDFLVLNQFHFNHKTLILSANKYPAPLYGYFCNLVKEHPSVPVLILHDLSESGMALADKLLSDESWPLSSSEVHDIGLNVDVAPTSSIWMPVESKADPDWPIVENDGQEPAFYFEQDYIHPLELWLNPDRMLSDLSLAIKELIPISDAHKKISIEMVDRIKSTGSAGIAATATGFSATYEVDEG